jgi:uncharacterized protein YkwD
MKTTIAQFSFLLMTSAALAACGGGGGAAAPAAVTVPAAPATVTAGYAAGSQQGEAFALLNAERSKCGFGTLNQSAALDKSAKAHANFLAENGVQFGHTEVAGLPFFSGVEEKDRAAAAGYLDPVGAVLAASTGTLAGSQAYTPSLQVRNILGAPYHVLAATDDFRDAGVGYASKLAGTKESKALNITLGKPGSNPLDAAQVYTYPCSGSTGVNAFLINESPSPIPSNLAQDFKLYGTPIAVKIRTGKVLALTTATITPTAGGPAVATQIVNRSNDPQSGALMRADSAFVLPLAPLLPGTSYTVQLAGANDDVALTKTFSFKTAN